jgi:hypothetical protein
MPSPSYQSPAVLVYVQADIPAGMTIREYRRRTHPRRPSRRLRLLARLRGQH